MALVHELSVSLPRLAKMIDHSLLHPTMTDDEIRAGLRLAKDYNVAAACIKPYSIPMAKEMLQGTEVKICAVIGFPHGNSTTTIKVLEATEAVNAGAIEIDMVVNVGKVLGGDWAYVSDEIQAINEAVVARGGTLKVIFENDYLEAEHITKLCEICSRHQVAFVKTSTGYGFVKQANGTYSYQGATGDDLALMRRVCDPNVQIKAAGGVRSLPDMYHMMSLGVSRVGATATAAILEEAKKQEIGGEPVNVTFSMKKTVPNEE